MPLAGAAAAPAREAKFILLRAESATPGAPFVPQALAPCVDCAASVLQVSIDGLHAAQEGAVLEDLAVSAMFDLPGGASVPFVAWRHAIGPVPSRTDRARFVAGRAAMRRLEVEYRIAGGLPGRDECRLAALDAPLLAPGHYVLLGPRRDGSRAEPARLAHSGDPAAPLSDLAGRDFDYLAIRIEAAA